MREATEELVAALEGMLAEWEKFTRYGSPMAKAANERVNFAKQAVARAKATPTLWCVHIPGPDDLHPMDSKEIAEAFALEHNEALKSFPWKCDEHEVRLTSMIASVVPWTGTAESHAETIARARAVLSRSAV